MSKYANSKGYDVNDIEFVEVWRQKENEIKQEQVRKSNISEEKKEELLNVALDYIYQRKPNELPFYIVKASTLLFIYIIRKEGN